MRGFSVLCWQYIEGAEKTWYGIYSGAKKNASGLFHPDAHTEIVFLECH